MLTITTRRSAMIVVTFCLLSCRGTSTNSVQIRVDEAYAGPVLLVAETPGGLDGALPVDLPSSGVALLRGRIPPMNNVRLLDKRTGEDIETTNIQAGHASTECGCFSRWLTMRNSSVPLPEADTWLPLELTARSEWERRRRAAGTCAPAPCPGDDALPSKATPALR
jgi:hypothetical protein